jgi:ferredoxin-thioredoxin reductase catalytic subunit
MRLAEHVAPIGRTRNVCRILVGKQEEKKQLGRPNVGGDDNIKIVNCKGAYDLKMAKHGRNM